MVPASEDDPTVCRPPGEVVVVVVVLSAVAGVEAVPVPREVGNRTSLGGGVTGGDSKSTTISG